MANLPSTELKSTQPALSDSLIEELAEHMAAGKRPAQLAKILRPNDPKEQKKMRRRIRNVLYSDPRLALALEREVKVEALVGAGPAVQALTRKARAGRTDAIKLLLEMTGFHNPRVQHDHSGQVEVKVTMPRPDFAATQSDDPVVDADVVDDP